MTTRVRFAAWCALASVVAVLVAGVVAIVTFERASDLQLDARIESAMVEVAAASTLAEACARTRTAAADQTRVIAVLTSDGERCRSNAAMPSPRAFGVEAAPGEVQRRTREVAGRTWRLHAAGQPSTGATVLVADVIDETLQARGDARRGIAVAMLAGAVLATLIGALAARPATRRIERLVSRIAAAARATDPGAHVGRIGARDLDAAARTVDELLDELRASDAARRRLFADAAHELRTPVTSIRTNAQLLERAAELDDDTRDIAARIARQSAAVGTLVAALVDHAAIDAWAGRTDEPVPLAELVHEAVTRFERRHPDANVELVLDASQGRVDRELVVRAVGNLLDNAAVHGDGTVRVELDAGTIAVCDEGTGIPADHAEHAFRPFARHGQAAGSGLGLAFVDHVARAHGGSARIASGLGARVELYLPPVDSQEALGLASGDAQASGRSS